MQVEEAQRSERAQIRRAEESGFKGINRLRLVDTYDFEQEHLGNLHFIEKLYACNLVFYLSLG